MNDPTPSDGVERALRDQLHSFFAKDKRQPWELIALLPDFRARCVYMLRGFLAVALAFAVNEMSPRIPGVPSTILIPVAAVLVTAPNIGSMLGAILQVLQGATFALCYNLLVLTTLPPSATAAACAVAFVSFCVTFSPASISFRRFSLASCAVTLLQWGTPPRTGNPIVNIDFCLGVTAALLAGCACGLVASVLPFRFFYSAAREASVRLRIVGSILQAEVDALVLAFTYVLPSARAVDISTRFDSSASPSRGAVSRAWSAGVSDSAHAPDTPALKPAGAAPSEVSPGFSQAAVNLEEEVRVDREPLERSDVVDLQDVCKMQLLLLAPSLRAMPLEPVVCLQQLARAAGRMCGSSETPPLYVHPPFGERVLRWADVMHSMNHAFQNIARADAMVESSVLHSRMMRCLGSPLRSLVLKTARYMKAAVAYSVRHHGWLGCDCQLSWFSCGFPGEAVPSKQELITLRDDVENCLRKVFEEYQTARCAVLYPESGSLHAQAAAHVSRVKRRLAAFSPTPETSNHVFLSTLRPPEAHSPPVQRNVSSFPADSSADRLPGDAVPVSRAVSSAEQRTTWRAKEWFSINAAVFGFLQFSHAVLTTASATCGSDLAIADPLEALAPEASAGEYDEAELTPADLPVLQRPVNVEQLHSSAVVDEAPLPETVQGTHHVLSCSLVQLFTAARTYCTPQAMRRAVRATIAVLVAIFASRLINSLPAVATLAPTTVIFLAGGSESGAFRSSSSRLIGTLLGTCVGYFVVSRCADACKDEHLAQALSLAVVCGLCQYARVDPSSSSVAVTTMFTATIIIVGGISTVVARVQQTLLGVFVYLLVSNTVFPISGRTLALCSLVDSLKLVQSSTQETLAAFTAFVRQEARRYQHRRARKPSTPLSPLKDTSSSLVVASKMLALYPELLLDAAGEPTLWRASFMTLGSRYADLAAGARKVANAVQLVSHCLKALHAQAIMLEQKFDHVAGPRTAATISSHIASLNAPLIPSSKLPSDRSLFRISRLSASSFDTSTHSGRGFEAFVPLMDVTESLTQHLDEIMKMFITELEMQPSVGILDWVPDCLTRVCCGCCCLRHSRTDTSALPVHQQQTSAHHAKLSDAVRRIAEDTGTFILTCDNFFQKHASKVQHRREVASDVAGGSLSPTGRLLMSNLDSIAFNTASYALQELADTVTDMAHVVRRLRYCA